MGKRLILILTAALVMAISAAPVWAQGGGTIHIVQRGQTLYSICRTYGVSLSEVVAANGLWNPNLIYAGQRLVIPGSGAADVVPPPAPAQPSAGSAADAPQVVAMAPPAQPQSSGSPIDYDNGGPALPSADGTCDAYHNRCQGVGYAGAFLATSPAQFAGQCVCTNDWNEITQGSGPARNAGQPAKCAHPGTCHEKCWQLCYKVHGLRYGGELLSTNPTTCGCWHYNHIAPQMSDKTEGITDIR